MTREALKAHYLAVADASRYPVLVYNMPQNTGISLEPRLVIDLAVPSQHRRAQGELGSLAFLAEVVREVPDRFHYFLGSGHVVYPGLEMGACGAILAVANAAPRCAPRSSASSRPGRRTRPAGSSSTSFPLNKTLMEIYGIAGLKHAQDLQGISRRPDAAAPPPRRREGPGGDRRPAQEEWVLTSVLRGISQYHFLRGSRRDGPQRRSEDSAAGGPRRAEKPRDTFLSIFLSRREVLSLRRFPSVEGDLPGRGPRTDLTASRRRRGMPGAIERSKILAEIRLRVSPRDFCASARFASYGGGPCTLLRQHSPCVSRAAGSGEVDCRTRDHPVTAATFRS